jgi:hypothetical protein
MAGNNSPHLRMTFQNISERASIGRWQANVVPGCDPRRDGRMVHRKHRRSIRRACQLSIEPPQPVRVEFASILARSRAVQDYEPQRPEVHRILNRRSCGSGQIEMPPERVTVVVVSGQDMDRRSELREQFTYKFVLAVGGVVGQVA